MIRFSDATTSNPATAAADAVAPDLAFFETTLADAVLPEVALPDSVWRANQMGQSRARVTASGYRSLDRELPNGGWPASVLIELLLAQNGIGELRLLAPTLAALTRAGKSVILLAPPHVPFAPALAELGLDLQQVLLIQTDKPMDRIWAVEQTLKSASFGALLCWLPQARADHLRRLQLAAGSGEGLCFVFRPAAAQRESSPAPLRLVCRASSGGGMAVEIVKRRGPVFGQPIVLPLPVPAALVGPYARRAANLPTMPTAMPTPSPTAMPGLTPMPQHHAEPAASSLNH
jgi:protein ImuA